MEVEDIEPWLDPDFGWMTKERRKEILKTWNYLKSLIKVDDKGIGKLFMFGTSGDKETNFEELKEVFIKPISYTIKDFDSKTIDRVGHEKVLIPEYSPTNRVDRLSRVIRKDVGDNTILILDSNYHMIGDEVTSNLKEYYKVLDIKMYNDVKTNITGWAYKFDKPIPQLLGIVYFRVKDNKIQETRLT